MLELEEAQN